MFTRQNEKSANTRRYKLLACQLLAGALALFPAVSTQASTVVQTNKAKVPVSDQGAQSRRQALTQALEQVLVKMSGTEEVLEHPAVRKALQSPAKYLSAYQFDYEDGQQFYEGEFSQKVLVKLLRDASLPVWGQRRPDTLIWLANQENQDKWILREGQPDILASVINMQSRQTGIPVSLPLMDLTDNSAISVYDVWGHFSRALNQASERYQPDFVIGARLHRKPEGETPEFLSTEEQLEKALSDSNLAFAYPEKTETPARGQQERQSNAVGYEEGEPSSFADSATGTNQNRALIAGAQQRNNPNDPVVSDDDNAEHLSDVPTMPARVGEGEYALEWVLLEKGASQFGAVRASSAEDALTQFMSIYAQYMGQRFAVTIDADADSQAEIISISIANLDGLPKYVHAQRFLNEMSVVRHAMLSKQSGSVATFDVKLAGTVSDFMSALSFDAQLQPVRDTFGQPLEGYNFYWNE